MTRRLDSSAPSIDPETAANEWQDDAAANSARFRIRIDPFGRIVPEVLPIEDGEPATDR